MKKIIILGPPGPFLKRDYERFGIGFLKKKFSVKFLDFTPWLYPNLWKECSGESYKCEERIVISCKNDFLSFDSGTDSIIVLDHLEKNRKTNWARRQLRKRDSLFVAFDVNLIPLDQISSTKFLKKFIDLITKPKKFFYNFFKFFENKYYALKTIYLPDVLVLGGLAAPRKSKVANKILAHSMDYDVYLKLKNKPISSNNSYAVFLDEDMITHPDNFIYNLGSPVSEFQYYSVLIKFLKKFEIDTGLQIKFAIHPKSRNNNLHNLLKGISFYRENTAELVKNSSVVLLHSSTSLSYAILFKKPAIFLTSNELKNSWIGDRINNFSKVINGQLINMSNDLDKKLDAQSFLKIDKSKYKNYLDQYIKVPNSPDIPLWEIVTDFLKKKVPKDIIKNL